MDFTSLVRETDASSNLFEVSLIFPSPVINSESLRQRLTLRINEFKPPSASLTMHEIPFMYGKVRVPSATINEDHTVQLSFRVDVNYDVYMMLLRLRNELFNPTDAVATTTFVDKSKFSGSILVLTPTEAATESNDHTDSYMASDGAYIGWKYNDVMLEKLEVTAYDHKTSEPIKANATFSYSYYEDVNIASRDASPAALDSPRFESEIDAAVRRGAIAGASSGVHYVSPSFQQMEQAANFEIADWINKQ